MIKNKFFTKFTMLLLFVIMLFSQTSCTTTADDYTDHDIENSHKAWQVINTYIQDLSMGKNVESYICNPTKIDSLRGKPQRIIFIDRIWNSDTTHSTSLFVFLLTYDNYKDDFFTAEVQVSKYAGKTESLNNVPCILSLSRGLDVAREHLIDAESWEKNKIIHYSK